MVDFLHLFIYTMYILRCSYSLFILGPHRLMERNLRWMAKSFEFKLQKQEQQRSNQHGGMKRMHGRNKKG